MAISKAQVLHIVSALVIVPVAGFVSSWTAKHFPGLPHFSAEEIGIFGYVGAGAAFTLALHYLHGWQVWEKLEAEGVIKVDEGTGPPASQGTTTTAQGG